MPGSDQQLTTACALARPHGSFQCCCLNSGNSLAVAWFPKRNTENPIPKPGTPNPQLKTDNQNLPTAHTCARAHVCVRTHTFARTARSHAPKHEEPVDARQSLWMLARALLKNAQTLQRCDMRGVQGPPKRSMGGTNFYNMLGLFTKYQAVS
jgi:hypothetical protein